MMIFPRGYGFFAEFNSIDHTGVPLNYANFPCWKSKQRNEFPESVSFEFAKLGFAFELRFLSVVKQTPLKTFSNERTKVAHNSTEVKIFLSTSPLGGPH